MLSLSPIRWTDGPNGELELIDQTRLPGELVWIKCPDVPTLYEAIKSLRVRGAPAIGVAAAYGVVVGVRNAKPTNEPEWVAALENVTKELSGARPTAVNLFWALDRMRNFGRLLSARFDSLDQMTSRLLEEAHRIKTEDTAMCRAIGEHGAKLLADGARVLTHCNAGALATSSYGTALAVIYSAVEQGKHIHVFADETRPLLQGARLTAWELMQAKIPVTLICDNVAATLMKSGGVDAVVVGADRIAANGDAANKIGTYGVAVLAKHHGIPFYVAAPSSTFDLSLESGEKIPIEERNAAEVTHPFGHQIAPEGVDVYNPAFDVTPAELITAIITENGIVKPVNEANVREKVEMALSEKTIAE